MHPEIKDVCSGGFADVPTLSKYYDLNIDTILENWTVVEAVRELLSNALDEHTLTNTVQLPEITKDKSGNWCICDFGRGLEVKHLLQTENPEKLNHPHVIGKFGVGLKDALATFERNQVTVTIHSKYQDVDLERCSKHGFKDITNLHAVVRPPTYPHLVGTRCVLAGVCDEDIEDAKRRFLAFSGVALLEQTHLGDVLEREVGCEEAYIFINGLRVGSETNFLFSYNITALTVKIRKALNRERQNIGRTAYSDRVKNILLLCSTNAIAQHLASDLKSIEKGTSHDELKWLDVQIHAVKILNAGQEAVFASSKELIDRPEIVDYARTNNMTLVPVSDLLASKLINMKDAKQTPIMTMTEFAHQVSAAFKYDWVLPEELTVPEQDVWYLKDLILECAPGGRPAVVQDIRIVRSLCTNLVHADGLWNPENKLIIVQRGALRSRTRFAAVLLHEVAHAQSGRPDVDREFESYLTDMIGQLVFQQPPNWKRFETTSGFTFTGGKRKQPPICLQ